MRPVSRRTRSSVAPAAPRSSSKWVTAVARRVGVGRVARALAAVAADRRVDRPGARRRAALDERQVLALDAPLAQLLLQRAQHRLGLGAPAAGRWCRGRGGGRCPPRSARDRRGAASACDERPGPVAGGRVHDEPGRLVDDEQVRRPRRRRPAPASRRRRRSAAGRPASRPRRPRRPRRRRRRGAWAAARPSTVTAPGVDQPLRARARAQRLGEHVVEAQARLVVTDRRFSSSTNTQRDHAERDRDVGDVELRPVRELDEVGHRARAQTRSMMLPSAPPSSRPVGSHAQRPRRVAGEARRRSRPARRARARSPARTPPSAPKATPLLRVLTRCRNEKTCDLLGRVDRGAHERLADLVERRGRRRRRAARASMRRAALTRR